MKTIFTVGELRKKLANFNGSDVVVIKNEETLYPFKIKVRTNVKGKTGTPLNEINLCVQSQKHFKKYKGE